MEVLLGAVIPAVLSQAKKVPLFATHPIAKFGLVFVTALVISVGYTAMTGGIWWPITPEIVQLASGQALIAIGLKAAHKNITENG